jgi:hypothetical protein
MSDIANEQSLVKPGHFGSSSENILIINNFVEQQDLETINKFFPLINEWENEKEDEFNEDGICIYDASYWRDRMCSGEILKRISPEIFNLVDKYVNKMATAISAKYDVMVSCRPPVLIRWLPGNIQSPHADKQLNDGTPNPFPTYDLNSVIYWNEAFTGGQIYYPQHDVEVKIGSGMAVAHPGDINYLHGVHEITSGERWTTPSFYTITKIGRE